MGIMRRMQGWRRAGDAWLKPPPGFGLPIAIVLLALILTGVAVTVPSPIPHRVARAMGYATPTYPLHDARLLAAMFIIALVFSSAIVLIVNFAAGRALRRSQCPKPVTDEHDSKRRI